MSTKFVFVTGGVVSGLGKGICAASLGRLLKQRGLRVRNQKFDPYINVDPGTMARIASISLEELGHTIFSVTAGSDKPVADMLTTDLKEFHIAGHDLAVAQITCVESERMTFNGALAGLVAITAGCDSVSPVGAFMIGLISGILVVLSVEFFDNIAKIDDPVGAVSVHMVNGMWGTLAVGLFSNGNNGVGVGLFYGGGLAQLGVQAIGVGSVLLYVLAIMGTLRANVAGFADGELSDAQFRRLHTLLETALADGALGVSLGLGYAPECFYSTEQLIRALAPLRRSGQVITVHMAMFSPAAR